MKPSKSKRNTTRFPSSTSNEAKPSPQEAREKEEQKTKRVGLLGADATEQEMEGFLEGLYGKKKLSTTSARRRAKRP